MLTYCTVSSIALLVMRGVVLALICAGPDKYPKKTKQPDGDFADLIIRKFLAEFLLVSGLKVVNGLATQLLWRFHVPTLDLMAVRKRMPALPNQAITALYKMQII